MDLGLKIILRHVGNCFCPLVKIHPDVVQVHRWCPQERLGRPLLTKDP